MIDTVNFIFFPVCQNRNIEFVGGLQVCSERLFDDQAVVAVLRIGAFADVCANRAKDFRREGEVENTVCGGFVGLQCFAELVEFAEGLIERAVATSKRGKGGAER